MPSPKLIIHTYPNFGREHNTFGFECWCGPTVQTVCAECAHLLRGLCEDCEDTHAYENCPRRADTMKQARADCWLCHGSGFVTVESPEEHDGPFGLNVLHKVDYP